MPAGDEDEDVVGCAASTGGMRLMRFPEGAPAPLGSGLVGRSIRSVQ